jgi:hypothetical protein
MAVAAVAFRLKVYPELYVVPKDADEPVVIVIGAWPSMMPVASKLVAVPAPSAGVAVQFALPFAAMPVEGTFVAH